MKSGFRLGNIKFSINNKVKTTKDFFIKKRVTIFSLRDKLDSPKIISQLKNFEDYYDRIMKLGVHDVYFCNDNNFQTVKKKFNSASIKKIKILPDENRNFTKHLGIAIKNSDNLDFNFMAIVTDGIIEKWWQDVKNNKIDDKKTFCSITNPENCINYLSGTE